MIDDENVIKLRVLDGTPRLIDLTSKELTIISDLLRRVEPMRREYPADPGIRILVDKPEFASVLAKIDDAKWKSDSKPTRR